MKTNPYEYVVKLQKTAEIYLYVTIFCALFGAVYEYFSFGVYSYYMIYAFLWPLVMGVMPFMIMGRKYGKQYMKSEEKGITISEGHICNDETVTAGCEYDFQFWHAGVATLTVGSMFQGIVKIYGTSSPFTKGYFIMGCVLLIMAVVRRARH